MGPFAGYRYRWRYCDRPGYAGVPLGVVGRMMIDGFNETSGLPYASMGIVAFTVPYLTRFLLDLLSRAWGGRDS